MSIDTTAGGAVGASPASYTHADWKHDVGTVLTTVAGIVQDLILMQACLAQVEGGATQRQLVAKLAVVGADLLQQGVAFVEATDQRLIPIYQAIMAAGGLRDVAGVKSYHQM
jgi:hypothetical protein